MAKLIKRALNLLLILSLSLIAPKKANAIEAIYVTNSVHDPYLPEMRRKKVGYTVWNNTPFNGVLIPPYDFQKMANKALAADELSAKGLEALAGSPQPDEAVSFPLWVVISVGSIALFGGMYVGYSVKKN